MGQKPEGYSVWIVCGGRVGRNLTKQRVWDVLDDMAQHYRDTNIVICHGNAVWVDEWSGAWAKSRGAIEVKVPIDGEKDGWTPKAPFNRNARILSENPGAAMCLGFPGGNGTFDMMSLCHKAGVPVADIEIEHDGTYAIKWWNQ